MQVTKTQRIGSWLVVGGVVLNFLQHLYFMLQPSKYFSIVFRIVHFIFGLWLSSLIWPTTLDGALKFKPDFLLWVPWSALILLFLLWSAIKMLRGQVNRVPYNVLLIIGLWMIVGTIYSMISTGFYNFADGLKNVWPILLSDLTSIAIIIGIGSIFLEYNKQKKDEISDKEMTFLRILFALDGRINRAKFWLVILLLDIIWIVGLIIDVSTTGEPGAFYWIAIMILFWPSLALNIKRCHDRNKSGWFYLIAFIPFVNIWYLIEIGFFKGTEGNNRFGSDPLRQARSASS